MWSNVPVTLGTYAYCGAMLLDIRNIYILWSNVPVTLRHICLLWSNVPGHLEYIHIGEQCS